MDMHEMRKLEIEVVAKAWSDLHPISIPSEAADREIFPTDGIFGVACMLCDETAYVMEWEVDELDIHPLLCGECRIEHGLQEDYPEA